MKSRFRPLKLGKGFSKFMSWSDGYVDGITYVHGYYKYLSPALLRFVCMFAGLEPQTGGRISYLELGYGQGISINIHAAATNGDYWGTDVNPTHVIGARQLAKASGADVLLLDDSFRELAARDDLPDFDFICLHGVWSWISDDNRSVLLDIIRRKLRVGGTVYVSYNCLPGWAPIIPIRELMTLFMERSRGASDTPEMIKRATEFARDVLKAQPAYLTGSPVAAHHLDSMRSSHNYVAHEYLNRDWKLTSFAEVDSAFGTAKLSYVASARLLDNIDVFRITPEGREVLDKIADPILRESVRDHMVNARFRCDVFVKGKLQASPENFRTAWLETCFVLVIPREDIPVEIRLPVGAVNLAGSPLEIVADHLYLENYRPKAVHELMQHRSLQNHSFEAIVDAMVMLVDSGYASPSQAPTGSTIARCQKLNRYLLERAMTSTDVDHLASPVTGGGIGVPHISQLFMNALIKGEKTVDQLADFVANVIRTFDEDTKDDNQRSSQLRGSDEWLRSLAESFLQKSLPMLKALMVI